MEHRWKRERTKEINWKLKSFFIRDKIISIFLISTRNVKGKNLSFETSKKKKLFLPIYFN